MQQTLTDYFIYAMKKQLEKRETPELVMDMRGEGLDFYARLSREEPLSFFCRGTCYRKDADGSFVMKTADGTENPINEAEYKNRLDYALSCIGASSEAGISVLVKKHSKDSEAS